MEGLVKRRTPVRAAFTKQYNLLISTLKQSEVTSEEVKMNLSSLERIASVLAELDEQIGAALIKDESEDYDSEYERCEEYRRKLDEARVRSECCLERIENVLEVSASIIGEKAKLELPKIENVREVSASIIGEKTKLKLPKIENVREVSASIIDEKAKLKLPKIEDVREVSASIIGEKTKLKSSKIELMKFNGEVKHWLAFWGQYSKIHDDRSIGDEDKLQYLLQCVVIGSRAREIVDSYPPTADNYSKVIDSLKASFGREELLVEDYVRELLPLVVKNVTNSKVKKNIMQLYDKLESDLRSLESIGVASDKFAAMLFPLVESCIPEELLRVWLRNPVITKEEKDSYGDKLSHLLLFLRAEIEGEERISLVKAGFESNEILTRKQNCKHGETLMPTANDLLSGVRVGKSTCTFCGKAYSAQDCCFKGQKMSYEEKMDILKEDKACFVCLKTGYCSSNCKTCIGCIVCEKRHCTLCIVGDIVCPGLSKLGRNPQISSVEERENASLFIHSKPEVFLQTLMVSIEANKNWKIVRTLFDPGAQRSYVLASTMDHMEITAQRTEYLTRVVFGGIGSGRKYELSWDSEVSEDMKKFLNSVKDVKILNRVKIPRKVCAGDSSFSLHVFFDVGGHCNASVVVLRAQDGSKITVQLVMARLRIAPLRQICPADLPSRRCSVSRLLSFRWWEWSPWLLLSEREWPVFDPPSDGRGVFQGKRKKLEVSVVYL